MFLSTPFDSALASTYDRQTFYKKNEQAAIIEIENRQAKANGSVVLLVTVAVWVSDRACEDRHK